MTALGAGLALLVGFVLGLLGGGGSVLMVPILIYVIGVPVKLAIASSLLVVGLVALIGCLSHLRRGNVAPKVALVFGAFAAAAAFAGARLAAYIPEDAQLILFAVVGLAGSVLMLRGTSHAVAGSEAAYEFSASVRTIALLALQGAGVGLLTGIIGVGGGFLIVPALVVVAGLPMRLAIGTSLLVIAMNAMSGFAGYIGSVAIDWSLVLWFTAFAGAASVAGTALGARLPQRRLKQMFGYLLIAVSLYVLYRR